MVQSTTGRELPESSLKGIFDNAAKKLYPRLSLFELLAKFKDEFQSREHAPDEVCEERRNFLDSFAYLCDVKKGGSTVTADALQKLLRGNILWLAANEGISPDVKVYAEKILKRLKEVEPGTEISIRDHIFKLVVRQCQPRVKFYRDKVKEHAKRFGMELQRGPLDDNGAVQACLPKGSLLTFEVISLQSKLKKLS
jgi:hypothetical protein